ncbi:MAG TPA: ACT domain-containing protein [Pyrinomonadaceae bacterium]|jgi:acetolactate synthase small subunit|nr:ilvH [Acidobacteriota bacterium]
MTHYIQVEMVNRFGELARVVNLISGRGFNIEKLMINITEKPDISQAKVSLAGDENKIGNLVKQINRQVRVTEARILTETEIENDVFFNA